MELETQGLLTNTMKTADSAFQLIHGSSDLEEAMRGAIYLQVGYELLVFFMEGHVICYDKGAYKHNVFHRDLGFSLSFILNLL